MLSKRFKLKLASLAILLLLSIQVSQQSRVLDSSIQKNHHISVDEVHSIPSIITISSEIFVWSSVQLQTSNIKTIDIHTGKTELGLSTDKEPQHPKEKEKSPILLLEFHSMTHDLKQYYLDIERCKRYTTELENLTSNVQLLASLAINTQAIELVVITHNLVLKLEPSEDHSKFIISCMEKGNTVKQSPESFTPHLRDKNEFSPSQRAEDITPMKLRHLLEFGNMLHPVKILILSVLAQNHKIQLSMLREQLQISWGKLKHHVAYLEKSGYISSGLEFVDGSPRVFLSVKEKGYQTFSHLSRVLKDILA